MICPKCGHAVKAGAAFCGDCGAAIPETKPVPASPGERLKTLAPTV